MESTVQEIFAENIKSDSETGITFIEGRNSFEHLSYKKIYLQASYKLHSLQEKGLKPGDELVFQFESNKNFVITFWACILGKIIPVPLAYTASANTIKKICGVWSKLKNPYVITDNVSLRGSFESFIEQESIFEEMLSKMIVFDELKLSKRAMPVAADPSDLVFIQFSSGSTGSPKGVTNLQEAILYNVNDYLKHLHINESDRFLGWVPLTHDMGLIFFHILPLLCNVPQFLMPPSLFLTYPEIWLETLSAHKITVSGSPNFGYKLVLENLDRIALKQLSLENLRLMINSAEPVSITVRQKFIDVFSTQGLSQHCVKAGYGLAEAVLGVALNHTEEKQNVEYLLDRGKLNLGDEIKILNTPSANAASFANLGTFEDTEITIVDEKDQVLPDRNLGFVRLRSKAITKGYYNDPINTQTCISKDGWLNTGDIGFIDNKQLVLTGRAKEMILINGQNYFPNDIDFLLEEIPGINFQQAISCNVFNENTHTDEIYVFVLYRGEAETFINLSSKIKKHISLKLGVLVSKVIAVDKIIKTTSGKPQRYVLRDNYFRGKYDVFIEEVLKKENLIKIELKKLTKNQIENRIIPIIREITGINEINTRTNFFDLGITSIHTVQIKVLLEELFMEKIDDVVLFKHTNIYELAEYVYTEVLKSDQHMVDTYSNSSLNASKSRIGKLLKTAVSN